MTDTHTHLYMDAFAGEEPAAVERALARGVSRMVFPNVDAASVKPMLKLHALYPEQTIVAMGLHPTEVKEDWREVLAEMEPLVASGQYRAIGETGIDLYWDKTRREEQRQAFGIQYDWAVRYGLPLIIHCRNGVEDTLDVISSHKGERPLMVFHSFTSGMEDVRRIREVCDPYFGINGVVTFKNARELREALPEIGIDRIVLETDSPYLAPTPHRGSRNESAYIPEIRDMVAQTLGLTPEETERITDRNASRLFNFSLRL